MPGTGFKVSGKKTWAVNFPNDPENVRVFVVTPSRSESVVAGPERPGFVRLRVAKANNH